MNKENPNETNNNAIKDAQMDKDKNNFSSLPLNEKEQNDSRINQNFINLQNSAYKNLKNDPKYESANIYA